MKPYQVADFSFKTFQTFYSYMNLPNAPKYLKNRGGAPDLGLKRKTGVQEITSAQYNLFVKDFSKSYLIEFYYGIYLFIVLCFIRFGKTLQLHLILT